MSSITHDTCEHIKEIIYKYCKDDTLEILFSFFDLVHIKGNIFDDENMVNEFRYANLNGNLIISRISFSSKRRGCLTEIMDYLCNKAKEYRIEKITIQSVLSVPMAKWCEKNGYYFDNRCNDTKIPLESNTSYFYGDYIKFL